MTFGELLQPLDKYELTPAGQRIAAECDRERIALGLSLEDYIARLLEADTEDISPITKRQHS